MRELTGHKVNGVNDGINVFVADEPGDGGACHEYIASYSADEDKGANVCINFQNGPLRKNGVNGLTQEVLIAICIDRLEGFQSGDYACDENQTALNCLKDAQAALLYRTRERASRGVEGTHKK